MRELRCLALAPGLLLSLLLGCAGVPPGNTEPLGSGSKAPLPTERVTAPTSALGEPPGAGELDHVHNVANDLPPCEAATEIVARELAVRIGQPLALSIARCEQENGWLVLAGQPHSPDGADIDYSQTPYAEALEQGFFEGSFIALLQHDAGLWHLVALEFGASDAGFVAWPDQFGVPRSLLFSQSR